jgi:hypothetical protein
MERRKFTRAIHRRQDAVHYVVLEGRLRIARITNVSSDPKPVFIDMEHLDPKTIPVGKVSRAGGSFALENFKMALALGVTGEVEPAQDKRLP